MTLPTLEQQLMAASGASRELDAEILKIHKPDQYAHCFAEWRKLRVTVRERGMIERLESCYRAAFAGCPQYTSDIDAALTLVPEGWRVGFEDEGKFDATAGVVAWAWPAHSSFEPDWQNGHQGYRDAPDGRQGCHPLRAIAICLACVRALITSGEGE